MTPLTRKLVRDLWRIKGQAIAIAAVIAVGVLMLVMMTGPVATLSETRRACHERCRLADVFARITRAPRHLAGDLARIAGVAAVETRVTGAALIDLGGGSPPVQAQAVCVPDLRAPRLNAIHLTDGRMLDGGRRDEVVLLNSFARAHGLRPGDRLSATLNGFRRDFRIVGLAQAPEFLYPAPPGEMVPDDARFAVLWLNRSAMEAVFDMQGAFNEAPLSLTREARPDEVIAAADRLLGRYGGLGAYPLRDLGSNRFISEEIKAQRPLYMRGDGIALSVGLAREPDVAPGQVLTLDVREGRGAIRCRRS